MEIFLTMLLYIVVTIFLVIFFRKAIEVFLLMSHRLQEKYGKEKKDKDNK